VYDMPALIRLTLDTMGTPQERSGDPWLFHRIRDGKDHDFVRACRREQRACIAGFLEHGMETSSAELAMGLYSHDRAQAYEMWSVETLCAQQAPGLHDAVRGDVGGKGSYDV
jgi:hypothetical protein